MDVKGTTNTVSVNIYPNPSKGKFQLAVSGWQLANKKEIKVFNISGEMIFSSELNEKDDAIDLSAQPDGIYFVSFASGEHSLGMKKLILNK